MFLLCAALLLSALGAVGCDESGRTRERDPDAQALLELSASAVAQAQVSAPGALLRQIDLVGPELSPTFRLTDASSTREIVLTAERLDSVDGFQVVASQTSKLLGHEAPGFSLRFLEVGPGKVVELARGKWENCGPRGLSLVGKEDNITWYVFCNTPSGVASATVNAKTGVFAISSAPPARLSRTATPGGR